jgi:hypothetical protein
MDARAIADHTPTVRMKLAALACFAMFAAVLASGVVRASEESPSYDVFAKEWAGHTRHLTITETGYAIEQISDGCCVPVITLSFQLSDPQQTRDGGIVRATATNVHVWNRDYFPNTRPAPDVGDTATIRLRRGILTEGLTGVRYCGPHRPYTCGA